MVADIRCEGTDPHQLAIVEARLTLNNTLVRRNEAATTGGGVSVGANAAATLNDSKVRNNTASNGGGINLDPGGSVTPIRTRVHDNTPNNCVPTGSVPGCIG
ncbi:hypothetical protein ABZ883_22285 [Streptomyces sp. NPDC046977]|uniref:hypothetical protein n=1 Tax=Streptomyces sp. NPDC046977 TaxID=3154703 RepID=UPI0033CABD25